MVARELLSKLNNLLLQDYQDGEYVWMGTPQEWQQAEKETDEHQCAYGGGDDTIDGTDGTCMNCGETNLI